MSQGLLGGTPNPQALLGLGTRAAVGAFESTGARSSYDLAKQNREALLTEKKTVTDELQRARKWVREARLDPVYDRNINQLNDRLAARTGTAEGGADLGSALPPLPSAVPETPLPPLSTTLPGSGGAGSTPEAVPAQSLTEMRRLAREHALTTRALNLGATPVSK